MSNKKILKLLDSLNKALEGPDAIDKKSGAKLSRLIQKINRKLDKPEPSKKENPLTDEIKDAIIHFEAEHPVVAKTLEQLQMALYSIGL